MYNDKKPPGDVQKPLPITVHENISFICGFACYYLSYCHKKKLYVLLIIPCEQTFYLF